TLTMASVGWFSTTEGMTATWEPLLRTSPASEEINADLVRVDPQPQDLLADFKPSGEPYIIAGRLTGTLNSAFPDGAPETGADAAAGDVTTHLAQSAEPANVILIADTDLLNDRFWVRVQDFFGQRLQIPSADNGDFVLNAVDNLAGSGDLISLRSRGVSARPFTLIEDMQREAERDFRATEKRLQDELQSVEAQLAELQQPAEAGGAIVTPEQEAAIGNFRQEVLRIRKELRDVQLALRQDIEALQSKVRFANIGLIPVIILVFAALFGIVRTVRRSRPAV
ncbi:MAG: ABC transporter, partial [Pseudomonadota bacterium]